VFFSLLAGDGFFHKFRGVVVFLEVLRVPGLIFFELRGVFFRREPVVLGLWPSESAEDHH